MRIFLGFLVTLVALALAGVSSASNRAIADIPINPPKLIAQDVWESSTVDGIADDVVGASDMRVYMVDSQAQWDAYPRFGGPDTVGLALLNNPKGFHVIILAPTVYTALNTWLSTGTTVGNEVGVAMAAMVLVHESFHWRLMSGDESTVNACALKHLPDYLDSDFGIAPTLTKNTTQRIPEHRIVYVKKRVRRHGRWVTKRVRTVKTVYVTVATGSIQVNNPEYGRILADAQTFYSEQPPPYNSGTCSV